MRKNIRFILPFIFLVLIVVSCKKDKQGGNSLGGSQLSSFSTFPLNKGSFWSYETEVKVVSDSFPLNHFYRSHWEIIGDTVINSNNAFKIEQIDSNITLGTVDTTISYYVNKSDGFYLYAVAGMGDITFLKKINFKFTSGVNVSPFSNIDTVYILNNPLHLIKTPFVKDEYWLSNEYSISSNTNFKRKWIDQQQISVPAGTFSCDKLQAFADYDNDLLPDTTFLTIYQYFSNKGLIKEERSHILTFSNGLTGTLTQTTVLTKTNF